MTDGLRELKKKVTSRMVRGTSIEFVRAAAGTNPIRDDEKSQRLGNDPREC